MLLYIHSLGFSEYKDKEKAEELVNDIIKEPTTRYISNYNTDEIKVEYYKEYGDDFGLLVRGSLNETEELTVHSLIPYAVGRNLTDTDEIEVEKGDATDIYNAYCEDNKSGTPISFFLQNIIDYMEIDEMEDVYIEGVKLVAFSVEGTIILPIEKDEEDELFEETENIIREELLNKAKSGDEEAMDILEEEALEASELLQERLKSEDLLSILEGFFVPVGDADDIYSILGIVEEVETLMNTQTKEKIYLLRIKCMSIFMDVYINSKDLVGTPSIGMRFKGTVWAHGTIQFEFEKKEEL
jgi:hypothetical protein